MKKKYIIISAIAVIAAAFIIYKTFFVKEKVELLTVEKGKLVTLVYATGNITAENSAILRSISGGIVTFAKAKEGESISKNTLLLKTDAKELELSIKQAETEIETAKIELKDKELNLDRLKRLLEGNSISQREYDNAKRDYDFAKVSLERKTLMLNREREKLSDTEIKAPFNCIIVKSNVKYGDYLTPNSECYEVIVPSSLVIEAEVDEQDLSKIYTGQKGVTAFDAFPGKKYNVEIIRMVPKTDAATKTSKVILKLIEAPENLNVGMTASVNIIAGEKENILIIPKTALFLKDGKKYVYIVESEKLKAIEISTGDDEGNYVEVTKGLKEKDKIVKEPKSSYKEGMKVSL